MYLQSAESPFTAALPVIIVIAVSTIAVMCLAWDIARRAIARTDSDKVAAVLLALARLAACLPWSGSPHNSEPSKEDHGA